MKRKNQMMNLLYRFIKNDGIKIIVSLLVITAVIIMRRLQNAGVWDILDWTIFTSIIVALFLQVISGLIEKLLMKKLEDPVKLTVDYESLMKKYEEDFLTYDNQRASSENLLGIPDERKEGKLPVIVECKFDDCELEIRDRKKMYKLPEVIEAHFDELFAAHKTSMVYNQLNIRVDDWKMKGGRFVMKTSRTTFYDSLVTNRAMDYKWENGLTVRDIFGYGPYLKPLKESCLSNHLGFNAFVESQDGYVVFVKRFDTLSIGKNTYGNSIGASLKAKYALEQSPNFTREGLAHAVSKEIRDELKIDNINLESSLLEDYMIAAYRDVVEGGKPQLLFYVLSEWEKDKIEREFYDAVKKKNSDTPKTMEDGKQLFWIPRKEIIHVCIQPDRIIYRGKSYRMMPSAVASVIMLIDYLKERHMVN